MKRFEDKIAINPMSGIEWHVAETILDSLISSESQLTISALAPGFEAEVFKITLGQKHFVLKVWNNRSKPDVLRQYRLLQALYRQGIRVSEPIGYGRSETGDEVLMTRYHGTPITKVNPGVFKKIANVFADIHRLPPDELKGAELINNDFTAYFFSGIEMFPEMQSELIKLLDSADMRMDKIIHGDFNLGNILEENGQYTVIDWTNGQIGDSRFDLAWACLLLRIYLSESKYLTFLYKYQEEAAVETVNLEIFEALACLRWLLLDRNAGVPRNADSLKKVRKIVRDNRFMNEDFLP